VSLLRDRSFLSAAAGHFAVDFLNGQRAVLVALLSGPLALSNAVVGLIGTLYTLLGSLSQPLFGWLADRFGARWVAAGGLVWMMGFFCLAIVAPGYSSLVLLLIMALGSGAFHPAGAMEATVRGRLNGMQYETTAAGLFFLFGQAGYSLGPALGGVILERWGIPGLLLLLVPVAPIGAVVGLYLGPMESRALQNETPHALARRGSRAWLSFIAFAFLVAFRSWAQSNMFTFLPKYYADRLLPPDYYGLLTSLYALGIAVGGVAGGWLADRLSKRWVIFWSLAVSALPLFFFPSLALTPWAYALVIAAGALSGASYTITVILGQHLIPRGVGAASGLVLGFTFASGALGSYLSGFQADWAGFAPMFRTTAVLSLASAVMALLLPLDD
jgi:FSR family fosmidomycin resistance protein-like MFS transporter